MTFGLSVNGSRKPTAESPGYHPFTDEEAKAFDAAVETFKASLTAAGLQGSIGGSRPVSASEATGTSTSHSISLTF